MLSKNGLKMGRSNVKIQPKKSNKNKVKNNSTHTLLYRYTCPSVAGQRLLASSDQAMTNAQKLISV